MARAQLKAVWTDTNDDETITEIQVSTDSKSMRPDEIDPTTKRAWMNVGSVAANVTEFPFELELPFTFVRTRVRAGKIGTIPPAWEPEDGHLLSVSVDGPSIDVVSDVALQILEAPGGGPVAALPSSITDLAAVAGVETDELDISFTAVDDGTGNAAKYRVRFLQGTATPIVWGTATPATDTCGTATPPSNIGDPVACTITGLLPNVAYQVQAESYRGTLGTDAVFGGLSNIATGITHEGEEPEALLAPSGLAPTGNTSEGLKTFSWNAVAGADQYRVKIHIVGQPYAPETVPTNYLVAEDQVGTSVQATVVAGKTYDWWIGGLRNGIPGPTTGTSLAVQGVGVTNPTPASLTPTPTTVVVDGTRTLTVTLTGAYDQPIVVNTSSDTPSVVTVPSTVNIPVGQVTGNFNASGIATGSGIISATYNGVTRQANIEVTPIVIPGGTWPNLPSGLTTYVDYDFAPPWPSYLFDVFGNAPSALTTISFGGTQPRSPNTILDYFLPVGGTTGGGQMGYDFTLQPPFRRVREVYFATWWATNFEFDGSRNHGNKMVFISANGDNDFLNWYGPNGSGVPRQLFWANQSIHNNCHVSGWNGGCGDGVNAQSGGFTPNGPHNGIVAAGSGWHLIEVYRKASTTMTSRDGAMRIWVDGQLSSDYTGLNGGSVNGGWHSLQYNSTWNLICDGTNPGQHVAFYRDCSKAWHHYYDHIFVAAA